MKDKIFVFKRGKEEDMVYSPLKKLFKYYQICQFPKPNTHLYTIRRFIYNEVGDLVDVSTNDFKKEQIKGFIKTLKLNQFKMIGSFDIDFFPYPNDGDVQLLQSSILNTINSGFTFSSSGYSTLTN